MATYNTSDDPYADGAPAPAQESASAKEKEGDDYEAGVLPRSFFQGKDLEVGSRCEVEITKIAGDQVLVKYVPHEEEKEEQPEPGSPPDGPADDAEMSSMME